MMQSEKVYFLAYYAEGDEVNGRYCALSACAKIKYLLHCIADNGIDVEVISTSNTIGMESFKHHIETIDRHVSIRYFTSKKYVNRVTKYISDFIFYLEMLLYLLFGVKSESTMLVYHSTSYMLFLPIIKRIKRLNIILDVEEIYSMVKQNKREIEKETKYFPFADKYIFPTESLEEIINLENKDYAIIYGSYFTNVYAKEYFEDGKIHCVYAGTFDRIKKGCENTIDACKYLDERYHVHILGFGTPEETQYIKNKIDKVSRYAKCKITYEGKKVGDAYAEFLNKCSIGLSTQNTEDAFNDTSFPSKVLTYLGNGLSVVSGRISVLERSKLQKYISFYEGNNPKEIAEAICRVDTSNSFNAKDFMIELNDLAIKEVSRLIRY